VFGQLDLFAAPKDKPEGLRYADAFVTKDEEAELIRTVAALPLQPFQFGAFEGKRRVTSFGFRYDYSEQRMKAALPIPDWISRLIGRVEAFGGANCAIRQVSCTEYAPGAGIGWHRDKPHFDEVFGLSLGSSCPFRFRRAAGKKWQRFTLEVASEVALRNDGRRAPSMGAQHRSGRNDSVLDHIPDHGSELLIY